MKNSTILLFAIIILASCGSDVNAPVHSAPGGQLFIMGGGDRTPELLERMIAAGAMDSTDYIAVLPMASDEPDSAFTLFCADIAEVSAVKCFNLNFTERDLINTAKLDSLRHAGLIFITGGDQRRLMNMLRDTPLQEALKHAYLDGILIAGTSAGAAVMGSIMITGEENFSAEYESTYDKIWKDNAVYAAGLGLADSVIFDQHFITRSRQNRLLSAICDHPGRMGIGIDEETAILVNGKKATVIGDSQVIVYFPVDSCAVHFRHFGMHNVRMDVLTAGDTFELK